MKKTRNNGSSNTKEYKPIGIVVTHFVSRSVNCSSDKPYIFLSSFILCSSNCSIYCKPNINSATTVAMV